MTGRGTSARTAVIKLGGRALEEAALRGVFVAELASLAGGGHAGAGQAGTWRVIVVHGGGAEVTAMSRRLGHEPRFHEGIRLTTADEMEVVDMVLAGSANKRLVRALSAAGVSAVGICGSDGPTLAAQPEAVPPGTRTGRIDSVDTLLLATLTDAGFVPVVSPVCDDGAGGGINVNADTVAFRVATALDADALLFISDIDGVLKEGTVVRRLDPASADAEIEAGTITDGMIPKIRSSVAAVTAGVGRVHIGDYGAAGALRALLDGARGTVIAAAADGAPSR
ncbi:MAG: acetylglutamate kinase [Spirochaetaceae bacterium]|nr:acetylglutamate kinase [Spirochaetaceae bacterium]